jgi:hypothetical protein
MRLLKDVTVKLPLYTTIVIKVGLIRGAYIHAQTWERQ